jgi:hypothetical protein
MVAGVTGLDHRRVTHLETLQRIRDLPTQLGGLGIVRNSSTFGDGTVILSRQLTRRYVRKHFDFLQVVLDSWTPLSLGCGESRHKAYEESAGYLPEIAPELLPLQPGGNVLDNLRVEIQAPRGGDESRMIQFLPQTAKAEVDEITRLIYHARRTAFHEDLVHSGRQARQLGL